MIEERIEKSLEEIIARFKSSNRDEQHLIATRESESAIIPLRDGSWTSIAAGPVFWPTCGGALIPKDISIRQVEETQLRSDEHRRLLAVLGVQAAPVTDVRSLIFKKHHELDALSPSTNKEHLHFLYLTHAQRLANDELRSLCVFDRDLNQLRPRLQDVYLPGTIPFGPEHLLTATVGDEHESIEIEGSFLHQFFLENPPERPDDTYPTWARWLCDFVGVLEQIRLVDRTGNDISKDFLLVSQEQPHLTLGALERVWATQARLVCDRPDLLSKLGQLLVPCMTGELMYLQDTYMPFHHLQNRCGEFLKPNERFPFLNFGHQPTVDDLAGKWSFLYTALGVSSTNDTGLLLDILNYIQDANMSGLSINRCQEVARLYCELETQCQESDEPESVRDICRCFIEDIKGVVVPEVYGADSKWTDPTACLWDAPIHMETKVPLRYVYEEVLMCNPLQMSILSKFFHHTLSVPSITWQDLALELVYLRNKGVRDFSRIMRIYECLDRLTVSGVEYNKLRHAFDTESIIFVPTDGLPSWVRRSQCLWSSTIDIDGKVVLEGHYSSMKQFFVRTLNVDQLTCGMVYDKLLDLGLENSPMSEVQDALELFSSMLDPSSTGCALDPQPLLRRSIWPVKYNHQNTGMMSAETDFVIVDRQHLIAPFSGRIKMLDFSLDQVWRLKPLFQWTGLERRYLSTLAKETTFVAEDPSNQRPCLNRGIKEKTLALIRIAAAFSSPRYKHDAASLCRLLHSSRVLQTNSVLSIYNMIQDNKVVTSQAIKSELHLAEESGTLMIYVPEEPKAQEVCFATALPKKLAEWLMGDEAIDKVDSAMVALVGAALNYNLTVLEEILTRQGIAMVEFPVYIMEPRMKELGELPLPSPDTAGLAQKLDQMCPLQSPPISEPSLPSPFLQNPFHSSTNG